MAISIDDLEIQIQGSAGNAAVEIENTASALGVLKKAVSQGLVNKLSSLSAALDKIKAPISINVNLKSLDAVKDAIGNTIKTDMPKDEPVIPAITPAAAPIVDPAALEPVKELAVITDRASGSLKTFSDHLKTAFGGLIKTKSAATDTSDKIKKVGDSASHGASGLSKFVSSLKRIFMYRAVRFLLSHIASAAREGIQNLVEYSRAIDGVDASRANETMSQFASIGMQVKNTLGAALMPVLSALMPIVQTVAGWFMVAANAVNQFLAAISGSSSWTKAMAYAVDFADGLDKAGGAAKALKGQLAPFDELNILSSLSGGGGGGGGSGVGAAFKDMFEEAEVPAWLGEMALRWKDIFFKWDDLDINDILKKVIVGLSTVSGLLIGWKLGGIGGAVIGATIGAGIGLAVTDLLPDFNNLSGAEVKSLIGAGLTGALGFAVGFGIGGFPAGVLGMMIMSGISLGIDKLKMSKISKKSTFAQGWVQDVLESIKAAFVGAGSGLLIGLLIGAIAGTGLTPIGMVVFGAVGALVGLAVDLVIKNIDNIKLAFILRWKSVSARISALPLWFKEKVIDPTIEYFKALPDKIKKVFSDTWEGAKEKWAGAKNWFDTTVIRPVHEKFYELEDKIRSSLSNAWGKVTDTWAGSKQWFEDNVSEPVKAVFAGIKSGVTAPFEDAWKGVKDTWRDVKTWFEDNVKTPIEKVFSNINMKFKMPEFSWTTIPIPTSDWKYKILSALGLPTSLPKLNVSWYASGGFPSIGELFIARERGPELVGTMGGRSAVVNNPQIVEGVSAGVYRAVRDAMRESNGGGGIPSVYTYLDSDPIAVRVEQRKDIRSIRTNGR